MSSQEKSKWFEGKHTTDAPPPTRAPEDYLREKLESTDVNVGQDRASFYERLGQIFQHISFIVLSAYRLKPGEEMNVSFNENLKFHIECAGSSINNKDPQWDQFHINGEWVGNAWGMQKFISAQCYEEFMGLLMRAFLKSI